MRESSVTVCNLCSMAGNIGVAEHARQTMNDHASHEKSSHGASRYAPRELFTQRSWKELRARLRMLEREVIVAAVFRRIGLAILHERIPTARMLVPGDTLVEPVLGAHVGVHGGGENS